jgi:hypothetical protein
VIRVGRELEYVAGLVTEQRHRRHPTKRRCAVEKASVYNTRRHAPAQDEDQASAGE